MVTNMYDKKDAKEDAKEKRRKRKKTRKEKRREDVFFYESRHEAEARIVRPASEMQD